LVCETRETLASEFVPPVSPVYNPPTNT
jgi:hypothetical protein